MWTMASLLIAFTIQTLPDWTGLCFPEKWILYLFAILNKMLQAVMPVRQRQPSQPQTSVLDGSSGEKRKVSNEKERYNRTLKIKIGVFKIPLFSSPHSNKQSKNQEGPSETQFWGAPWSSLQLLLYTLHCEGCSQTTVFDLMPELPPHSHLSLPL